MQFTFLISDCDTFLLASVRNTMIQTINLTLNASAIQVTGE
jgi:hypothetical protein